MVKLTKLAVIPVFLFLFLFGTVQSQAEYSTDKAAFSAEYPGLTPQMFADSNAGPGESIFCDAPIDSTTNNPCVTPGVIDPAIFFTINGSAMDAMNINGPFVDGFANPNTALVTAASLDTFIIRFTEEIPVNVVGLDIGCFDKSELSFGCSDTVEVEVFGFGGNVIGGFELDVTDQFDSFLGISNGDPIRQIRITPMDPEGAVAGVDAVYFGFFRDVPTMSEWGMIATVAALGLVSFMVLRRRKSAVS